MYSTLERFLRYVTYDTQSVEGAQTVPSTPGQAVLAEVLAEDLRSLGINASVSEHAYVTASLPSNLPSGHAAPAVGFVAHMDTATELTGKNVAPRVVENYDGGEIVLRPGQDPVVLSPADFPYLADYKGQDVVVTDGNTLLGADNKAGIAEIIGAVDYLVHHPEIRHGDVKIAFTPDEEVGHLAKFLDVEKWGADFAYTLDGGPVGEISYENFNAAGAKVTIKGRAVHPGKAKGLMLNAVTMGQELNALFPPAETPATTEGYEGYYHCMNFEGSTESAVLRYIIRDHDSRKFDERKRFVEKAVAWMNDKYGGRFTLEIWDQYRNMLDKIKESGKGFVVDTAMEAMRLLDITPRVIPMRGGTDGATLTQKGLVTPNLFTGGHNYHGRFEFISVQAMEKATSMVLKILDLFASPSPSASRGWPK
ncbi:MAG: peptidase T [Synergistaceae bacterium]|jgi:tripeptide aminopeptidase|nr:peptidase T [Synergistaceae bacterium]